MLARLGRHPGAFSGAERRRAKEGEGGVSCPVVRGAALLPLLFFVRRVAMPGCLVFGDAEHHGSARGFSAA